MIWSFIATCCFALVAAIIFEAVKEVYHWFSPDYVNRKKILKELDYMIVEEGNRLKDPNVYPSSKTSALQRVNCLVYIKEIIKSI